MIRNQIINFRYPIKKKVIFELHLDCYPLHLLMFASIQLISL